MFTIKENKIDLQELLEATQAQLLAAEKGQFNYNIAYTSNNETLQQIVENLNKVNVLREEYESRQQQKIDTMLQINKIGFWELDLEEIQYDSPKNKVIISPELKALLGYRPDELKDDLNELLKITHPDYGPAIHQMMTAHLQDFTGQTPFDMVHEMKFKDGSYRWVRTYGYSKRRPDGTPYRMLAVITDIHEELTNKKELEALINRYDLIMDVLEEAPWDMEVLDGDPTNFDNPWWWSDQFRRALGYQDEHDFPNVVSSWANSLHPDDEEIATSAFLNHLNDRTGKTPFSTEYRLRTKSGEYRWFAANGKSKRDENGVVTRVAGTFRDITHLKMKEQNVAETTSRMEK